MGMCGGGEGEPGPGRTLAAGALNVKAEHTQRCNSLPRPLWRVTDNV